MLEVLLLYLLICSKNCAFPKPLAVERTQECFKSRVFFFFCILHLLEANILFEDIVMFITGVRVVPPLGIEYPKRLQYHLLTNAQQVVRASWLSALAPLNFRYLSIIKQKRIWGKLFWPPLNYQMVLIRFELIYLNILYPQYRY